MQYEQYISDEILNKVKDLYMYENPFYQIFDKVLKNYNIERKSQHKNYIKFDENNFYNHSVKEVIDYLNTLDQDAIFEQHVDEYDHEINLYKVEPETEEQYIDRLGLICACADNEIKKEKNIKKMLEERKSELLAELEKINSQINK